MTDLTFQDPKSLVNRAAFNERFSVLNRLYQYWWKRRALAVSYTEVKTEKSVNSLATGDTGDFIIRLHDDSGVNNVYSITADLKYSDKINIDQSNGEITLVSPKTISGINARSIVGTELSPVIGKYVQSKTVKKNGGTVDNGIYLIPSDIPSELIAAALAGTVMWGAWTDPMYKITSKKVVNKGNWEYIFSDDRSAYPDSGEQNGYEYQFLGIPFENAREAPKIVIGSYVGTGKYGQSNPNELIFDSVPKIVILFRDNNTPTMPYYWGAPKIAIENGSSTDYCTATVSNDPVKLNFYSDNDADNQFNSNGKTYTYFALC